MRKEKAKKIKKAVCGLAVAGILGLNVYTVSGAASAISYSYTLGSGSTYANTAGTTKNDANDMVIHCATSTVSGGYFNATSQYFDNDWYNTDYDTVYCGNKTYSFSASAAKSHKARFHLEKAMSSTSVFTGKWATTDTVSVY
ncbi:MAG: hypothetical protein PUB10_04110 [Clostridiales bacterium]|nr:hypothetical protein [Clostridiales bacterium]